MEAEKARTIKIAVIGAGLIGKERVKAIQQLKQKQYACECIGIYDPYSPTAAEYATQENIPLLTSLEEVALTQPDWVIICIPHDSAIEITEYFLAKKIKVLIEKPLGRSVEEAQQLLKKAQFDRQLWVGFNYRFYEGIRQAFRDANAGMFGDIVSVNMTLGHGGRPGDEKSWKLDPVRCGGGSMLDPGIHLLDLINCLSSSPVEVVGAATWDGFWKTGIDEECHLILRSGKTIYNLNISILRWRSTFKIEIHGTDGYGIVTGRNRSYGNQKYIRGKRWGWQSGKSQSESETFILENDGERVFEKELEQLLFPSEKELLAPCSGHEALQASLLWQRCMQSAQNRN